MRRIYCIILIPLVIAGSEPADSLDVAKSPRKAILYSTLPGGGQIYNGKYLKAAIIFGAEVYVVSQFVLNRSYYHDWEEGKYELPKYRYRQLRNKYAWWIGFIYIYGLLDALVDSHLSSWNPVEFEGLDDEKEIEEQTEGN